MIYNFHKTEGCRVTIAKLAQKIKDELDWNGSNESIRIILKRKGFKWRRTQNNRKVLIEKSDIPKFNFLLRTTPFWKFSNYVNSIDSSLKSCLERILNLRLTDLQWRQSTLPIRFGGLEIRRMSDICLPAFLSSINEIKKLVSQLLNSKDNELIIHHYDEALAVWDVENENERPTIPQFQKN
jgi:hypothetical protein